MSMNTLTILEVKFYSAVLCEGLGLGLETRVYQGLALGLETKDPRELPPSVPSSLSQFAPFSEAGKNELHMAYIRNLSLVGLPTL